MARQGVARSVSDAAEDASRALVATVIALGNIPTIAADLQPDDLALTTHTDLWTLYRELTAHGDQITPDAVATLAARKGITARLPEGGRAGWAEQMAAAHGVPAERVSQIAVLVREAAARRRIDRAAVEASSRARAGAPAVEIAQDLDREVKGTLARLAPPESPCISLATVTPEQVTWLWTGRLAFGKVTVLDGLPGTGKSTVTCDLAARVSRGQPFPGDAFARPAGGVIFLAAEDGVRDTVAPRLDAAGADRARCFSWPAEQLPALPDGVAAIETAIQWHKARLLICDPVTALLARDLSANSDADVRRALTPLAAIAEKHGVCVVLLRHLNKRIGGSALDRGGGSIGIAALARTVLLLGREDEGDGLVLAAVKANLTRAPRSLRARIVDAAGVGRVEWLDECDTTADDLVAEPDRRKPSKRDDAAELIRTVLADGEWHRQREALAAVEAAGIAERTWKRAKTALGVESRQREREWWWRIPKRPTCERVALWPGGTLTESGPLRESSNSSLDSSEGQRANVSHPTADGTLAEAGPLTTPSRPPHAGAHALNEDGDQL